jgi:hypothetical protein
MDVFAIPPPDFIIQATTQLWQFIFIGWAFFAGVMGIAHQYLRAIYYKHKKLSLYIALLIGISLFISAIAFILYHYFG